MDSTGEPPESIATLSLIHNLSSNSILTEVKPKGNEDTQSLSPENVSSDYYKYPSYLYEGLSSDGVEIQTVSQDTIEILKTDKEISGIILLLSMIGAIVLTYRKREGVKRQSYFKQVSREREDSIELVDVNFKEGVKIDD